MAQNKTKVMKSIKEITIPLVCNFIKIPDRALWEQPHISIVIPAGTEFDFEKDIDNNAKLVSCYIGELYLTVSLPNDVLK